MSRLGRALCFAISAWVVVACTPSPGDPPPLPDTGMPPRPRDTGPPQDARDAAEPPDTGPNPDPVLPAQSWTGRFMFDDFSGQPPREIVASFLIDARAEAGTVRAVIGANGRSNTVVFDIPAPGLLIGRRPIDLGVPVPASDCRAPAVRVVEPRLVFRDADGDGVFEELSQLTVAAASGAIFAVAGTGSTSSGDLRSGVFERDTAAPILTLLPARPLGAIETLQLVASEPLDPSIVPYVEAAGRRFALHETAGASAPSHWSLALSSLPIATGYALHFDGVPQDLAGNPATLVPETAFDVEALEPLRADGFESGLFGIAGEGLRSLLPEETPLAGLTSAFATGRVVMLLQPPRSATFVSFLFRLHADSFGTTFTPWVRVRDASGALIGSGLTTTFTDQPSTVAGFANQTSLASGFASFTSGSDSITVEIDLYGSTETWCTGATATDRSIPLGITIDSVEVR